MAGVADFILEMEHVSDGDGDGGRGDGESDSNIVGISIRDSVIGWEKLDTTKPN